MVPGLRRVYRYDHPAELLSVLAQSYDLVIDTEQWYCLSALVTRLVRSRQKVGFATNVRRRMFTHPVDYRGGIYEVTAFLDLAREVGLCPPDEFSLPFLTLPSEAVAGARKSLGAYADRPYLAIFPGGSLEQKGWPVEKFCAVATQLAKEGFPLVVVGGPDDRDFSNQVARAGDGLSLAGELSLLESAAIVSQASVLLSNDSGLLHMAVGLNTSVLGLFGPSSAKKWGAPATVGRTLQGNESCSPCSTFGNIPQCHNYVSCMKSISPDEVLAELRLLWKYAQQL